MFHNYSDGPENPEIIVDYWYINDNEEDPYRYTYVGLFMDGGDDETPTFILVRFDKSVDKRPTIRRINVPERFWQLELGKTGVNLLRRGNDGWLDIIHGYIDGIIENPDAWLEWPSRLYGHARLPVRVVSTSFRVRGDTVHPVIHNAERGRFPGQVRRSYSIRDQLSDYIRRERR